MNARLILLALMTTAVAAVFGPSGSFAQERNLFAVLRGPNEIPSADPDGSGTAMVTFRTAALTQICVVLFVDAIDTPRPGQNGAHIHRGGGSVNGPIVVPLDSPGCGRCFGVEELRRDFSRIVGGDSQQTGGLLRQCAHQRVSGWSDPRPALLAGRSPKTRTSAGAPPTFI